MTLASHLTFRYFILLTYVMTPSPGEEEQRHHRAAGLRVAFFRTSAKGGAGGVELGRSQAAMSALPRNWFHKQIKKMFSSFCAAKIGLSTFYSANFLINRNQTSSISINILSLKKRKGTVYYQDDKTRSYSLLLSAQSQPARKIWPVEGHCFNV